MPHELQSPELQAWAAGFPLALLHAGVTLLILVAGSALYALITPHREIQLIREGNAAAAVSFGGMLVALGIPLAVSLASSHSLLDIGLWGVATLFVQLLVFRLTDFLLHGLPQRIQEGEMAAAALLVCAKLATAIVLAAAVSAA
jgi:putative membrane protein